MQSLGIVAVAVLVKNYFISFKAHKYTREAELSVNSNMQSMSVCLILS